MVIAQDFFHGIESERFKLSIMANRSDFQEMETNWQTLQESLCSMVFEVQVNSPWICAFVHFCQSGFNYYINLRKRVDLSCSSERISATSSSIQAVASLPGIN